MQSEDIRWKQRFQNFEKAVFLLKEVQLLNFAELNLLEKEGIIQRFEFTLELAWKCLKDRMEYDGIVLERISPKNVIRQAFTYKYITQSGKWIEMIAARNIMSHVYDIEGMLSILKNIKNFYIDLILDLYTDLQKDL